MSKCRYCQVKLPVPAWKTCERLVCVKARQKIANIRNIAHMKKIRAKWRADREKLINIVLKKKV